MRRRPWTLCERPAWAKGRNQLLDIGMILAAVRIIGHVSDAHRPMGQRRGELGTGFLITVPSETLDDHRYGYVVTAHHLLWDQNQIEVQAPNPTDPNGALYPPDRVDDWRQPLKDVDLAVAPFDRGNKTDNLYQAVALEEQVLPADIFPGLGSDIYYIGILAPLDRPMVRSGNIGGLNQTGITHDGGYEYPVHLVDCRSYGGFSGSPCFVHERYARINETVAMENFPGLMLARLSHQVRLCGMFTSHLTDRGGSTPISAYGVGTMLRSQEIWEALMSDDMRKERREWDEENGHGDEAKEGPRLEPARRSSESEFDRFEDLTRRLVNTPKPKRDESES